MTDEKQLPLAPETPELALAAPARQDALAMLTAAAKELSVEHLERLVTLQERIMDREAKSAFAEEMARFQKDRPDIMTDATLPHLMRVTKSGAKRAQRYATLDHIRKTIQPHLGALSYGWDTEYPDDKTLVVTCTVRHPLGHSESSKYKSTISGTAGMSDQQKVKSGISYGMRVSLIQRLGLTECDEDTDGAGVETVTDQQATELEALAKDVGVDEVAFKKWAGVQSWSEIPAAKYDKAKQTLLKMPRQT
jgi:hypothetical protein